MNSHSIKLSGSFEVMEALEIDKDYEVKLTGSIDTISKHTENNGDFNFVYALKPLYGEVTTDKGDTVKMVKKGSKSQVLRAKILVCGLDYDKEMDKLIQQYE